MHGARALCLQGLFGTEIGMGARQRVPDDGKLQMQGGKDDTASPQAEGGEVTRSERFPSVKRDDSVEPSAEQRTVGGETAHSDRRREPDPSVSHGQTDAATPDER